MEPDIHGNTMPVPSGGEKSAAYPFSSGYVLDQDFIAGSLILLAGIVELFSWIFLFHVKAGAYPWWLIPPTKMLLGGSLFMNCRRRVALRAVPTLLAGLGLLLTILPLWTMDLGKLSQTSMEAFKYYTFVPTFTPRYLYLAAIIDLLFCGFVFFRPSHGKTDVTIIGTFCIILVTGFHLVKNLGSGLFSGYHILLTFLFCQQPIVLMLLFVGVLRSFSHQRSADIIPSSTQR